MRLFISFKQFILFFLEKKYLEDSSCQVLFFSENLFSLKNTKKKKKKKQPKMLAAAVVI